jgi:hypothetical protein
MITPPMHYFSRSETRRIYEGDFIQYFGSKDVYMFKAIYFQYQPKSTRGW